MAREVITKSDCILCINSCGVEQQLSKMAS